MDTTPLHHAIIAALVQLFLCPMLGPWGAAATAVAIFLGREIAQNERQALSLPRFAGHTLATLPWWAGLRVGWSMGSVLDVLVPALACGTVAVLLGMVR